MRGFLPVFLSTAGLVACGATVLAAAATDFKSGPLAGGETWRFEFLEPGDFDYYCTPHPWMKGRVSAQADAPGNATHNVTILDFKFQPPDLVVPVGASVAWTNRDDALHTVTAAAATEGAGLEPWQVVVGAVSLVGLVLLTARLLRTKPKSPPGSGGQP